MASTFSAAIYTLPLIIAAMIAAAIAAWALYHRTRGAYSFAAMMGAISWWLCAYALELTSVHLSDALIWGKLQYLSIATIPPLLLLFAVRFSGYERPFPPLALLGLGLIPALTLVLVGTNEIHGLIWARTSLSSNGAVQMLSVTYGWWFWVHTVASYAMVLSGCGLLVWVAWQNVALYRAQALILMVGALTPIVGNLIYLLRLSPVRSLDLTPFFFMVTGLCLAWGVYRTQLLAVVPVARKQVVERMSDGVLVLDQRGFVADVNPAARAMLGERVEPGKPLAALDGAGPLLKLPNGHGGPDARAEATVELDLHGRSLSVRSTALHDQHDRPVGQLIVLHDITDRKRYEHELRQQREVQRQLAEQAEAGSRAKSAFIANMSHELRTPLSAILGYSDLVASELAATGRADLIADMEQVSSAGWHLLSLVDQVLSLTKIEFGQLELQRELVDVTALLEQALAAARPLAEQGQNSLDGEWGDDLGLIDTDPSKLKEIVQHLLSNACKFTHRGRITVVARREGPVAAERASATSPLRVEHLVVEVRDTGIGMAPEEIRLIFDQFTQVDSSSSRRYGGMGLGLALARAMCELLGGVITVESTPGQGSTFTVLLPVRAPHSKVTQDEGLAAS